MSNIKVYLRVRPSIKNDHFQKVKRVVDEEEVEEIVRVEHKGMRYKIEKLSKNKRGFVLTQNKKHFNERSYAFEEIFDKKSSQDGVYYHFKDNLLNASMNGVS